MEREGKDLLRDEPYESLYIPGLRFEPKIPHYYGDRVRKLFLLIAAIVLIFQPMLGGFQTPLFPFELLGSIILVILAALTTPTKQLIMVANAAAAGIGMFTYELTALSAYYAGDTSLFIAREAVAVAFLFALYFSIKTVRAMVLGIIGKRPVTGEFLRRDPEYRTRRITDADD
jgi:hypothetical protein